MNGDATILIVDDDQTHLSLVERYVTSYGFRCKSAQNGIDALNQLQSGDISILVTDMVMPEMDGMELLKKTKEYHPDIDVIVMTGYSKQYSYIEVIKAGATDFIAKPFRKNEFEAKLNRVFRERRLIKELREAKEKAEAGSKAKTAFLCTISHELRTPMHGILGFSGLLTSGNLPPEETKYANMVAQSADRLMKLLNQILDFSSIEAGKSDLTPYHFQLHDLFEEVFVSARPKAETKGLSLSLKTEKSLSDTLFFGDKMGLAQVLYNLIDNSIKFSDTGSIEIEVKKTTEFAEDRIELQFSVRDNGCGISPEKQEAIFEPFTQAEEYITRKHEGAGLGLAICAKLVSMMSGDIWLKSDDNRGATFYFTVRMEAA